MMRKIVVAAFILTFSTGAWAQTATVSVTAWAGRADNVEIFTSDGVQKGTRDFKGAPIAGTYTWNRAYNLVEVQKDVWVDRERLVAKLCGNFTAAPVQSMPGQAGGQAARAPSGMSSGTSCAPTLSVPR